MGGKKLLLVELLFSDLAKFGFLSLETMSPKLRRCLGSPRKYVVWQRLKSCPPLTMVPRVSWASPFQPCLGGWGTAGQTSSFGSPLAVGVCRSHALQGNHSEGEVH